MTSDTNGGSWQRVAAELRACREAQQRAWGDIDNTTLGRYLAGEVSPEERRLIESALDELPELRKLTDLVRDVLDAPASVPYGPSVLPYPASSPARAAGQPSTAHAPPRPWQPRSPAVRFRQRAGLVAAAGLLLALGVALPRPGGTASAPAETSLAFAQPTAARGEFFVHNAGGLGDAGAPALMGTEAKGVADRVVKQEETLLDRIDASVRSLQAEGHKEEAERLARQYADNLTRQAMCCQEKGDLLRAESSLETARRLYASALGPQAPETVRTRNSLAGVYQVVLNTTASPAYASSAPGGNGVNLYFGHPGSPPLPIARRDGVRTEPSAAPPMTFAAAGLPPPLHSSSAYGSPVAAPAPAAPRGKLAAAKSYAAAVEPAALALRERLTSQNQRELRQSVVPVLAQALREAPDPTEGQRLALALGRLGPAARGAVPALVERFHHTTAPTEQATILLSLGDIGPAAQQSLPVLVEAARSESADVRRCAARALVQLGSAARPAVERLVVERPADGLFREVLARLDGPEGHCGIEDRCECFSVKAIQETRQEIQQLAAVFHVEVGVETSPDQVVFLSRDGDERKALFQQWRFERTELPARTADTKEPAKKHVRRVGEHCIYLHIDRDAAEAQVYVSETLKRRGLTDEALRRVLESPLRDKDYDRALREAVRFVARFEREHGGAK